MVATTCHKGLHTYAPDGRGCPNCRKDRTDAWHSKNKDYVKSQQKLYAQTNAKVIQEYQREYRSANRAQLKENAQLNYEANKERYLDYRSNWKKEFSDRVNTINAKRRAAKLNRTPKWLGKQASSLITTFYNEAKRLSKETGVKFHVDHIVPLQGAFVSGLHVPWNLQVIPAIDNMRKNNRGGW